MQRALLLFSFLLVFAFQVSAQNVQQIFEEGKNLFDNKQYALAQSKLASITSLQENNEMVQWASYYYAISAYYADDRNTAKNMFLQILTKYPYWDVKDEINFWLAYISAENGDVKSTFDYLYRITNSDFNADIENLKYSSLASTDDLNELKAILDSFSNEEKVASRMAEVILSLPSNQQDVELLTSLENKYELNISMAAGDIEASPKKKVYNIGVFLPFYYRSDSLSLVRVERNWTAKMLFGAKIAVEKLAEEGIEVNLLTYDTRGNTSIDQLIASGELDDLDLMIGPVTRNNLQAVSNFSKEKKINMVNPLSANNEIIENNPYAFLYYPSNQSIARRAADYTKQNFTENKNTAIFYSGIADKARADLYKELIEKDSFQVVIFEGVRPNESVNIQQMLLDDEEVDKDSLVVEEMLAEMDSLREAEVEDWELYDERDFVYDTLKILPDSIGHIFIASDYSSLATSALSGIDARPDTIEIITSSRFLAAEQSISFEQLDRLDAVILGSNLIDYSTDEITEFRQRFLDKYLTNPTKVDLLGDEYLGYDLMMNFGRLLGSYGKYFQLGLKRRANVEGELIENFNYRFTQDNNFIPYLKVRGSEILKREE